MEDLEATRETSRGADRRKKIFDLYSNQLRNLVSEGLLPGVELPFVDTYICPICLKAFSSKDLADSSPNMLTLEDAPPKSLGGKANVLTCRKCNNTCGHEIDFHLTERLIEIDSRAFLPNTQMKAKLKHKGKTVQGTVKVDSVGKIVVTHATKNNHPENLNSYISQTGKGNAVEIEYPKSRVDVHRLEVALLKTGYMLAFAKFGYAFILDTAFDQIREQLKNPEMEIYPEGFWTKQAFT